MISEGDRLFGRIAIVSGYLTRQQVLLLLKEKQQKAPSKPFGLFLVDSGVLTRRQYEEVTGIRRDIERKPPDEREASVTALERKVEALLDELGVEGSTPGEPETLVVEREPFDTKMPEEVEYLEEDVSHLTGASLDEYLRFARATGASDFHYQSGSPPFVRVAGSFRFLRLPVLAIDEAKDRLMGLMESRHRRRFVEAKAVDFTYATAHGRYRVNVFLHHRGVGGVFRVIEDAPRSLEDLNLPPILRKFTTYPHGVVLVTGPAGCGKSTTLASLVDIVNEDRHDHIVMIEDPIEFIHPGKNCNVTQREVGRDTRGFHSALRASLREDPDVIVVGEMRDLETISMAITAAETGHLVFGTLHTTNATRTVDRMLDVFPPREQPQIRAMLSESLRGVVSQVLVPRADEAGRIPAVEILFNTPAVANIIREAKTYQLPGIIQTSGKQGMVLMDDSLVDLYRRGLVTLENALFYAEEPARIRRSIGVGE